MMQDEDPEAQLRAAAGIGRSTTVSAAAADLADDLARRAGFTAAPRHGFYVNERAREAVARKAAGAAVKRVAASAFEEWAADGDRPSERDLVHLASLAGDAQSILDGDYDDVPAREHVDLGPLRVDGQTDLDVLAAELRRRLLAAEPLPDEQAAALAESMDRIRAALGEIASSFARWATDAAGSDAWRKLAQVLGDDGVASGGNPSEGKPQGPMERLAHQRAERQRRARQREKRRWKQERRQRR